MMLKGLLVQFRVFGLMFRLLMREKLQNLGDLMPFPEIIQMFLDHELLQLLHNLDFV